jgi:hypothetical protein
MKGQDGRTYRCRIVLIIPAVMLTGIFAWLLKIMEVTEIQLFIWYKIAIILGAIFPLAKKILENSSIREL